MRVYEEVCCLSMDGVLPAGERFVCRRCALTDSGQGYHAQGMRHVRSGYEVGYLLVGMEVFSGTHDSEGSLPPVMLVGFGVMSRRAPVLCISSKNTPPGLPRLHRGLWIARGG